MASDKIATITDANFEQTVLQNPQPVLVDFWADWCMPCRMLSPTVDQLADEYDGKVTIGKLNTDDNHETAIRFGIQSIPTLLLFKGGQVVRKFVGLQTKKDLKAGIDQILE